MAASLPSARRSSPSRVPMSVIRLPFRYGDATCYLVSQQLFSDVLNWRPISVWQEGEMTEVSEFRTGVRFERLTVLPQVPADLRIVKRPAFPRFLATLSLLKALLNSAPQNPGL